MSDFIWGISWFFLIIIVGAYVIDAIRLIAEVWSNDD
jgi:hypothetical protein